MLGIICALRREAPRIGNGALVAVSGPGRANAARAARQLAGRHRLSGLISAGFAGALSTRLRVGELVVDTADPEWRGLAERERATVGLLATVDRMLCTVDERHETARRTGALAADMESEAVADVARRLGLRFAAIRAITDTADRDLVLDWNGARRPDGSFRMLSLLGQALRTQQGVAEIRHFWYASRLASGRLRHFVEELLRSDGRSAGQRESA